MLLFGTPGAFKAQYVANYPWYQGKDLPTFSSDTRGKIVLLNRFDESFTDFGFVLSVDDNTWTNKSYEGINYHIQDLYKVDAECDNKVRQTVDQASAADRGDRRDFYLNFASGVNAPESIRSTAAKVNPRLQNQLGNNKGRFGTIPMDFPPFPLINSLIESNF